MVTTTLKHLLTELRDGMLDELAHTRRMAQSDWPPVRDEGEVLSSKLRRWVGALEEACQQTRAGDGENHQLRLRLV